MITINQSKPYNVTFAPVYRYMEDKYIEDFLSAGKLRLSSFKKFREYPDEIRGDKKEGGGTFEAKTKEGMQYLVMTNVGNREYVLCSSLINDSELNDTFETKGCLKINKPLEFSIAVSNALIGFSEAFLGFCNYQPHRIIKRELENFSTSDFTNESGELIIGGPTMNKRNQEMIQKGIDLLFLKEDKYQTQAEYRFLWSLDDRFYKLEPYIDIECKSAIQFCEKIER